MNPKSTFQGLLPLAAAFLMSTACGASQPVPNQAAHPANPEASGQAGATQAGPGATPAGPGAAELAAYQRARPVFQKYCASCHTPGSPKAKPKAIKHFAMSGYPFGGHHAPVIGHEVREVLGATGEKPTMPKDHPGAVKGDELKLILAWADAFDAAHPNAKGGDDDEDEDHDQGHDDDDHDADHDHGHSPSGKDDDDDDD